MASVLLLSSSSIWSILVAVNLNELIVLLTIIWPILNATMVKNKSGILLPVDLLELLEFGLVDLDLLLLIRAQTPRLVEVIHQLFCLPLEVLVQAFHILLILDYAADLQDLLLY